jgi:hypothetical protein
MISGAVWAFLATPPAARAATVTPGVCRAVMIFDRSGSVGQTGIQTMQAQVRRLFEPTGLYDDKIQLAFWSFSDGNHLFRLPAGVPDYSYDTPGYGYVSSKGTNAGFDTSLSALASTGGTNYEQGFGYNNGTRNANLGDIPDKADIIVFMTDGKPNQPGGGVDGNPQAVAVGRAAALHYLNAGKVVLGGLVGADVDANTLAKVINGDANNHNNLFTVSSDYNDLSAKLKQQIGAQCNKLTTPCPYDSSITADDPKCVPPSPPYSLIPSATTNNTVISSDESATFQYKVNDTSTTVTSGDVVWSIKQVIVDPGKSADPLSFGTDPYRDGYSCGALLNLINSGNKPENCKEVATGTKQFPPGVTTLTNAEAGSASQLVVDDRWPIGTKICYVLALNKPTQNDSPKDRYSRAACVVIGKRPTVQMYGGDLSVGGQMAGDDEPLSPIASKVQAGVTIKGDPINKVFGSWVEYGIFAPGSVIGVASAAGLEGGYPSTTGDVQSLWSKLTFANENDEFGQFADARTIPDTASALLAANQAVTPLVSDTLTTNGLAAGTYQKDTGDLTIVGGTTDKGKSIIINVPNGTVTITGNLNYTSDPLASLNDVPRLVIIARNINITSAVTNIDGWLIARNSVNGTGGGTINTCSDGPAVPAGRLSINDCNQQLRINGPVISRTLWLRRTAGSGSGNDSGQAAEIINLRADTYLSALARRTDITVPITTYSVELPPRF